MSLLIGILISALSRSKLNRKETANLKYYNIEDKRFVLCRNQTRRSFKKWEMKKQKKIC